jgi:hypothetical protein
VAGPRGVRVARHHEPSALTRATPPPPPRNNGVSESRRSMGNADRTTVRMEVPSVDMFGSASLITRLIACGIAGLGGRGARVSVIGSALFVAKATTHTSYTSHRTLVLSIGLALGVLIVILGIPLFLRKIHPNRFYGLNAALQYESKTKWYSANRYLGGALIVAGLVTIALTGLIWIVKPSALSKSNKLLALVEILVVAVPAVLAYIVAYTRLGKE